MITINDKIYIKKYMGTKLSADTSEIYVINNIYTFSHKNSLNNNIVYEKRAILNNGNEQLIYTYDIITKKRTYYVEKVPFWYNKLLCCT
jgi:hypothetical protein